jgi:hypothetical protein
VGYHRLQELKFVVVEGQGKLHGRSVNGSSARDPPPRRYKTFRGVGTSFERATPASRSVKKAV